jgi:hypothetical protein
MGLVKEIRKVRNVVRNYVYNGVKYDASSHSHNCSPVLTTHWMHTWLLIIQTDQLQCIYFANWRQIHLIRNTLMNSRIRQGSSYKTVLAIRWPWNDDTGLPTLETIWSDDIKCFSIWHVTRYGGYIGFLVNEAMNEEDNGKQILGAASLKRKKFWKELPASWVAWPGLSCLVRDRGGIHQMKPCNRGPSPDSPSCGGVIWQNKQSHTSSVTVCGFSWIQISSLRYTFLWNQVTMMRFRYVKYCTLSAVRNYWRNKVDEEAQQIRIWSRCKGRLVRLPHSYPHSVTGMHVL